MAKRVRKKKSTNTIFQDRSYKNLLYGVITVIILFSLVLTGAKFFKKTGTVGDSGISTQRQAENKKTYTVIEGDNLWGIAEKTYNDGYQWVMLARVNNIDDPNVLTTGTKLVLPTVSAVVSPTPVITSKRDSEDKIVQTNYVVVEGDNLWDICVRAYGDGYRWTEIARVNNLVNPDLIHPGNRITLPR